MLEYSKNRFILLLIQGFFFTLSWGWISSYPGCLQKIRLVKDDQRTRWHHVTASFAKRKKAAPVATSKKIQVKLLKHVAGTGQAGEVINVTPAFFNNRLRPTALAKIVSDEEVEQEKAKFAAEQLEIDRTAESLKERIGHLNMILKRKVGPNGQLFGGIGPKMIMDELHSAIPENFLLQKTVKITGISEEDGKKMRGDIKSLGSYQAKIALTKDYSATLIFKIEAE